MDNDNQQPLQEQVVDATTALTLPIDDADLIAVINDKVSESLKKMKELRIDERRKLNRDFWKGNQLDVSKLDLRYQVPYIDNIIYDDLETRVALAAGRMPDIITTPAKGDDEKAISNAKDVGDFLSDRINSSMTKRLLKDALRNYHLDFNAVIKVRWDEHKGENGDFIFELVRANRIGFDHTATIPHDGFTADNLDLIYEWIEEPLAVVLNKYPTAKPKIIEAIGGNQAMNSKKLATKIRYKECWFRWYTDKGELMYGKVCLYGSVVMHKEKNPYWDWQGTTDVKADDTGQYQSNKIYRNYFDQPRMPYILLTYQNLGDSVYDDTTPVEQAVPIQRISNKRGAQITELADRVAPRYAFLGSVMTKEEARRVDPKDPTESIWLDAAGPDADIRKTMVATQSSPPPPILYQDQVGLRARIDSKFNTHGTTRGEVQTQESGVSKQITREGDLTIADDMSDIVVERVVYEMACWGIQMGKLFYDKPHKVKFGGKDGQIVDKEITQDVFEDGMTVEVKASSVDKQTRRSDAMQLVANQSIDPQTLFEDLDVDNPKERTRRLIAFQMGQNDGFTSYMKEVEGDDATNGEEELMTPEQAQQDLQALISGQPVEPAGIPGDAYVQVFAQFIQSPDFANQPPQVQQVVAEYVHKLKDMVNQKVGSNGPQAPAPPVGQPAQVPQAAPSVQTAQAPAQQPLAF